MGHVNVIPGHDGIVRSLLLRQADDGGAALWAMAAEAIRVADREKGGELRELPEAAQIGSHGVPAYSNGDEVILGAQNDGAYFERLRPARLHLDYVGPGGSFAGQTYGFSDLLEGKIGRDKLRDKYVLIGATAAALGDRLATPFTYAENDPGLRADELTPGIEILANALGTILRGRFYRELPDWSIIALAALAALSVYPSLTLLQGRREGVKQIAAMAGLALTLWLIAYFAFTRWLIIPPLVPIIATGVAAALLSLLRRSLAVSAGLDARISELASLDSPLGESSGALPSPPPNDPMHVIARLSGAEAAAIISCGRDGERRFVACHGAAFRRIKRRMTDREAAYSVSRALSQDEPASDYFDFNGNDHFVNRRALVLWLGGRPGAAGDREGLFEAADGGVLFLDELASTSATFQASLLRVLQSGEVRRVGSTQTRRVNVRIIGASNAPLREMVAAEKFRADLFYRLSVLTIDMPPLRERLNDVEMLTQHFLRRQTGDRPWRLTREAAEALRRHQFPGNVRELENALIRAVALATDHLITLDCLPPHIARGGSSGSAESSHDIAAPHPPSGRAPLCSRTT